jgi:hypothetical protein
MPNSLPANGVKVDRATRDQAKSRARRLRKALTWDGISDEEILERDGWRCQIPGCKRRPIRKDLKFPHSRSKSIDHVVPLSHGGDDTAANKRAAHLGCNMARGNQMGTEQMALFGVVRELPLASEVGGSPRRFCGCGQLLTRGMRCRGCRQAEQEARAAAAAARELERVWPSCKISYYTCRYCSQIGIARAACAREVCPARACQLARLAANNLRIRNGLTKEAADSRMQLLVRSGSYIPSGRWGHDSRRAS